MEAVTCPNCGHHHMLYTLDWGLWLTCPKCGHKICLEEGKMKEVLVNEKAGTMRRMLGKVCPRCSQMFPANTEKCPKEECEHCLLTPVWGEAEPLIQAS